VRNFLIAEISVTVTTTPFYGHYAGQSALAGTPS